MRTNIDTDVIYAGRYWHGAGPAEAVRQVRQVRRQSDQYFGLFWLIIKYQFYLITCPSNTPDQRKIAPAGPVACRDMVRYGMLKQGGVGYVMPYGMVW